MSNGLSLVLVQMATCGSEGIYVEGPGSYENILALFNKVSPLSFSLKSKRC